MDTAQLDDKWLKATVLGSLWASFEIIVGSMLHNLRIPFAGSLLTLFAVILLISFAVVWQQKGIIIRAGLICALMKSISPSAVIIGPMTGIITEALIVETIIRLTGRNLLSFILAGSLTVLSALLHKVVNLIILYGFDLIEVYKNMVIFASKKLDINTLTPAQVFNLFILSYLIIGALGGITGFFLGKNSLNKKAEKIDYALSAPTFQKDEPEFNPTLGLLTVHLLFLVSSLLFFGYTENIFLKTAITSGYLIFNLWYYGRIARRLMKPIFWIQLLFVLLLAGVFMETSETEMFSIENAITNGWNMFMRTLLVVTAFSSISIELANPLIRNYLTGKGFSRLYVSLQLAFRALPVLIEKNGNLKNFLKYPVQTYSSLIGEAENWLNSFKNHTQN